MEGNGFSVANVNTTDVTSINQKYDVPENLEGCHTTIVGKYVIEGLVPAKYVHQVIDENRFVKCLSVPGIPTGAPGMPGAKSKPLNVCVLDASTPPKVFASFDLRCGPLASHVSAIPDLPTKGVKPCDAM